MTSEYAHETLGATAGTPTAIFAGSAGVSHAMDRLAMIEQAISKGESSITLGSRLRAQGMPGDEVAALLTQVDLRRKARVKFGDSSSHMLFTQAGLEQASRDAATQLHAQRFEQAGCKSVADLGCGIGSESMALRAAGISVLAVELDPFTARRAKHNISALSNGDNPSVARVVVGDAQRVALNGYQRRIS